jgi:maltose alpha-D-glucosyltransferase / alpha-amylase
MPQDELVSGFESDPLWYKDAIIYEVHVRSFYDSVDDGMGDFPGLTQRLDYIQDLGVTVVWILPICPSPWKDDGYDISDYTAVHPTYGSLKDFENFLREAHRRGIRVITELVLNHTSDQHEWFQKSRRAKPGSHWRDFYVWSDTPDRYKEARIIFKDFEASNWTWDPVANAYFWHRFYSHQPDLNFDNPAVRKAMFDVLDFWLDRGVDGLRLDAVPYLYEREGTNCENLPETHAFLKDLRQHIDSKYKDRMILAEANQWPEDAIAYFGTGDECNMAFHFPLMPRLFMALRMEDRYPVTDILQITPPIPDNCQWALFLRNHDELTLEMVTDEERDYMYRVYAQDRPMRINLGIRRRLAPLLGNDRRRIELMNALLLSLPGTPVIYYGDEIGMGDNFYLGDRNGVRTPMQWNGDRNSGFSRATPQKLYLPVIIDPEYQYSSVNVEAQQNNVNSLLWWMKRTIAQRRRSKAFGRGSIEFLFPENRKVLAFIRQFEGERIFVVANLSRFSQAVELDLRNYQGNMLIEMFGGAEFPAIGDKNYVLTLAPHAFYWFEMQPKEVRQEAIAARAGEDGAPVFHVNSFQEVFSKRTLTSIAGLLPIFLGERRWFLARSRRIQDVDVTDVVTVTNDAHLLMLRVDFDEGDPEFYTLPLSVASGEKAEQLSQRIPEFNFARLQLPNGEGGILYSALRDPNFHTALLNAIASRKRLKGTAGEVLGSHTRAFRKLWGPDHPSLEATVPRGTHNHTSIDFGDRFFLKLFRKVDEGVNPDREIHTALTDRANPFCHVPQLAGYLEYRAAGGEPMTIGILEQYVHHETDAWCYATDQLGLFYEHALAKGDDPRLSQVPLSDLITLALEAVPPIVNEIVGSFLEMARLLGTRSAEFHRALASNESAYFGPEPFTDFYRQGLYHGMLGQAGRAFEQLRAALKQLPESAQSEATRLLQQEREVRGIFKSLRDRRIHAVRTRVHGDYHLGQVLFTGKDFVLIDFEGDPGRAVGERRIKLSPVRDVASMLRSFHYAANAVLFGAVPGVVPQPTNVNALQTWASFWYRWVGAAFLGGYLRAVGRTGLIPESRDEFRILLNAYTLERALIEIRYEVRRRSEWARVPIVGVFELLDAHKG